MATPAYQELKINLVGGDANFQVEEGFLSGGIKAGRGQHLVRGLNGVLTTTTGSDNTVAYVGVCAATVDNTAGNDVSSSVPYYSLGSTIRFYNIAPLLTGSVAVEGKWAYVSNASSGGEIGLSGAITSVGSFQGTSGSTGGAVLVTPLSAVRVGAIQKRHNDGSVEVAIRIAAINEDSR